MMSDISEYLLPGYIGLFVIGGLFGIGLGISAIIRGILLRGWESGWSLIARDLFSIFTVVMIASAYSQGRLGEFWTFMLLGLAQVPVGIYIFWNDYKFRKLMGDDGPII